MARPSQFILLSLLLLTVCSGHPALSGPHAVRILPLGDSITQGSYDYWSYRYRLWQKLIDHGIPFDLVGSMDSHFFGNPDWPDYQGMAFDPDHEGHWGWEANEILDGRPGEGSLAVWLESYTPEIVLLHLGTNDVLNGQSTGSSVSELESVIAVLQADNPDVTVLLARLIPSTDTGADGIPLLNVEMGGIAAAMATPRSRVVVVDQYEGFVAATDLSDPWHPNEPGEEKMATKWMQALVAGPLAVAHLRWDAGGSELEWDLPPDGTGSRLYQGLVSTLADGDGDGVRDARYGDCLAELAENTATFTPAADPQPGQIVYFLVETRALATWWGLGTNSRGQVRVPALACP